MQMTAKPDTKIIQIDKDVRRELKRMALPSGKELKPFIEDLLKVMVEFNDFASVKWLVKQSNKKK